MSSEIDVFLRLLLNSNEKPVNMSPLCERLTTDIAGQLAFGQQLKTQTESTNRVFPRAMVSMNAIVNIFSNCTFKVCILTIFLSKEQRIDCLIVSWPKLSMVWPLLRRLNKKNNLAFGNAVRTIIQGRMALPKDAKHDLYSIAADGGTLEGEGLARSELWAEAVFFLPAGEFELSSSRPCTLIHFIIWSLIISSQAVQLSQQPSAPISSTYPGTQEPTHGSQMRSAQPSLRPRISRVDPSFLVVNIFVQPSTRL